MILLIVISWSLRRWCWLSPSGGNAMREVRFRRPEQVLLGERLGDVLVAAGHAAAGPVEHAVLRRQHDDRRCAMPSASPDQCSGLLPIETGHHELHEDERGLVKRV